MKETLDKCLRRLTAHTPRTLTKHARASGILGTVLDVCPPRLTRSSGQPSEVSAVITLLRKPASHRRLRTFANAQTSVW